MIGFGCLAAGAFLYRVVAFWAPLPFGGVVTAALAVDDRARSFRG